MKKPRNSKLYTVLGLLLLVGAAIFFYPKSSPAPTEASLLFKTMAPKVEKQLRYYTIDAQGLAQGGVIIFPDDLEDSVSYAPMAEKLSAMGFQVRVVRYPLGRTIFKTDYKKILPEDSDTGWVSIGIGKGANKACFLGDQSPDVKGLILIGACSAEVNLNDNDLQIIMYQEKSNPMSEERMEKIRKKLPADTKFKMVGSKDQILGQLMTSMEESYLAKNSQTDSLIQEIYDILIAEPILSENGD